MIPSDMKKLEVKGQDSYIGAYENGKMKLSFDYGLNSYDKSAEPNLNFKYVTKKIDGVIAKIFSYKKSNLSIMEVHFPKTGAGKFKGGDKLTMTVTFTDQDVSKYIYSIFESIRFKQQPRANKNSSVYSVGIIAYQDAEISCWEKLGEAASRECIKKSEADCKNQGGKWGGVIKGRGRSPGCNLSTHDGGKVCEASDQCESACFRGACSEFHGSKGCGFMERQKDGTIQTICID